MEQWYQSQISSMAYGKDTICCASNYENFSNSLVGNIRSLVSWHEATGGSTLHKLLYKSCLPFSCTALKLKVQLLHHDDETSLKILGNSITCSNQSTTDEDYIYYMISMK